ncbi:MAG: glycosyltransferase, partial [Flavobacteriales bacterium]
MSILIPAYNEENTIRAILDKISEVQLVNGISKEIIIVNDASKDKTASVVEAYIKEHPEQQIQFFSQQVNQGKGAA